MSPATKRQSVVTPTPSKIPQPKKARTNERPRSPTPESSPPPRLPTRKRQHVPAVPSDEDSDVDDSEVVILGDVTSMSVYVAGCNQLNSLSDTPKGKGKAPAASNAGPPKAKVSTKKASEGTGASKTKEGDGMPNDKVQMKKAGEGVHLNDSLGNEIHVRSGVGISKTKAVTRASRAKAAAGASKAKAPPANTADEELTDADDAELAPKTIYAMTEIAKSHLKAKMEADRLAIGRALAEQQLEAAKQKTMREQFGWLESLGKVADKLGRESAGPLLSEIVNKTRLKLEEVKLKSQQQSTALAECEVKKAALEERILKLVKEQQNAKEVENTSAEMRLFEEIDSFRPEGKKVCVVSSGLSFLRFSVSLVAACMSLITLIESTLVDALLHRDVLLIDQQLLTLVFREAHNALENNNVEEVHAIHPA
ncbi:hypothetical protein FRC10_005301 [Ceratobasidium sp. 414]|nr:hypothetical protein FRC10_005301 [Ceratobasidium sp. 414]